MPKFDQAAIEDRRRDAARVQGVPPPAEHERAGQDGRKVAGALRWQRIAAQARRVRPDANRRQEAL